ncbi:MAG: OmpH family outer membrane protein [Pseudomonadota bacterium]|nr:OmpH family outer membrane protein [Pseudomonadota bacterium]
MNGRTFLSIFFIGSIFSVSNLIAQDLSGLKVGVVNVGRLLQESPQAVAATQSLEDEFAPRRREFLALQSAYEAKAAQLEQDRDVMGASERENVQRDLRDDQRELLRTQNEFREDLDIRRNEALGKVQQEVFIVIDEFGKSQGYDLIFAEGIVFASKEVDVTQQILEKLIN